MTRGRRGAAGATAKSKTTQATKGRKTPRAPRAKAPPRGAPFAELVERFRAALPDLEILIEDLELDSEGSRLRFTLCGTQRGPLLGAAPTGRSVMVRGIAHQRGAESWTEWDEAALRRELAADPE